LHCDPEVEALLIADWLRGLDAIPILDEASVSVAREAVRQTGRDAGLPPESIASLVIATSELAHNQLAHARGGAVAVHCVSRDGIAGVEVVAADNGPGLSDPRAALAGATPNPRGLGRGFSAVRRLCSELDADIRLGEGSCFRARVFAEPLLRGREVGVMGRPHPEEASSGDHAAFVRRPEGLWLLVVDGLGHGPAAREASDGAIAALLGRSPSTASELVEMCHRALRATRGAVLAAALIDEASGEADFRAAGNVNVGLLGSRGARWIGGSSFVVGSPQPLPRIGGESCRVERYEAIVMCSDGIVRRGRDEVERSLLLEHPIVLAQHVLETRARSTDDALVLVAR
jgi:anti-sigma regulatory factor (Ser/Thr protein kinase)